MTKKIPITCELDGLNLVDIHSLQEFQDDLKFLHKNKAAKLKKSIERYGITFPGYVWNSPSGLKIIDSHQRVRVIKMMLREGWELEDNLFPVVFIKADNEKEAKKKVLLAASMYGETTDSGLHDFLANAQIDVEEIIGEIDIPYVDIDLELSTDKSGDSSEDEVPEPEEAKCKKGDLWILGDHRLLCGDATKREDVDRLMAGKKADMVFTDPPYNVGFMSRKDKKHALDYTSTPYEDSKSKDEWHSFVSAVYSGIINNVRDGGCFYMWGADKGIVDYYNLCPDALLIHQNIIWNKEWPFLTRRDFLGAHEPCIYGWKKGEKHTFNRQGEGENYSDIWSIKKHNPNEMVHSAQKPIGLIEMALRSSSDNNDKILDFFGGSGSTLIACEKLNRKCCMMEIDPHYCDVIIKRWEEYTGKTAVLSDG